MHKKLLRGLTVILAVALLAGCSAKTPGTANQPSNQPSNQGQAQQSAQVGQQGKTYSAPPAMTIDPKKQYDATIATNMGDIRIKLFANETPKTVNNFVFLAKNHFYDGLKFHRVIKDFMIQTGDPNGDGTGGPGYTFADELPPQHQYAPGIVAMANAGPNTNGSQFFIGSGNQVKNLNQTPNYTVFGEVTGGMNVVQSIASVKVGPSASGEVSSPLQNVTIKTVTIEVR